ncbi:MAG: SpoIIE family protein phosphatase [Tepidisphaeraceae bacterium]|jgi:CHASE2 domain-containing sensor protein
MTRLERRVFSRSLVIGALLTLIVLAVHAFGLLDSLEYWLYDQRAIHCQLAEPAPTNRFVHLDIDDASVSPDALGRWPWPREDLARILDEVHRAGPSAVGLDILFSEPQEPRLIQEPGGKLRTIDDDADLAEALRKCGNTVLAASFKLESGEAQSASPSAPVNWLAGNLEMTPEELNKRLKDSGKEPLAGQALNELFIISRRQAMKSRIDGELDRTGEIARDALFKRLLPHRDPDENSPLRNLFLDQYQVASAERAVYRFGAPRQTLAAPPAEGIFNVVPLSMFSNVAAGCAFANYDIFDNATIRAIPLFVEYNQRLYPQMGLATACVMLGADPAAVRFDGSNIVIPAPAGAISIPTYTYHSKVLGRDVPLIAALPWFGGRDWETMYDWPAHLNPAAHISIASIWDICTSERKIAKDSAAIDLAISNILASVDPSLAKKYAAALPDPLDTIARENRADVTLDDLKGSGWLDYFAQHPDKDLSSEDRAQKVNLYDARDALKYAVAQSHQLRTQIDTQRRWLASQIGGKGVLIGFTATGFQDQVSTSLHLHCPGVVVHGVIVNAVLTGNWWRMAPAWVTVLLTILFGMAAAAVQGRFQPLRASVLVLLLLLGYALFNGYILFDWHKWIVGLAGPSVAMLTVWAGCTLDRLIIESIERHRVATEVAVISKEMDLARQVQVALIPTKAPKIVGLEAEGWALTASVTGGDCYDLWQLKDGRLAILLADASGHGLAPAMVVSQVRTLCRSLCEFESHPQGLLDRVNRRLADDLEPNRFVTAFLGFLGPDGTLDWSSAGHGPMYWSPGPGSEMLAIDSTGLPLGIQPDCFFDPPSPSLLLAPGGSLVVFSDGIFEAHAPDGQMFGVERVKEILEKTAGQPLPAIIATLRSAVQKWQAKLEPDDDQTIVVVRREC